MSPRIRSIARAALAACVALSIIGLSGCNRGAGKETEAAAPPLLISPEDVLVVRNSALTSGPSITGSVEPERRADLRAEVAAVVLTVLKENGEPVKRGDLLVRLDQTSIRDSLTAAEASMSAAAVVFRSAAAGSAPL